jgi:hypothetical protein
VHHHALILDTLRGKDFAAEDVVLVLPGRRRYDIDEDRCAVQEVLRQPNQFGVAQVLPQKEERARRQKHLTR